MTPSTPVRARVLLGKVGLDGHDRGIKVIARLLRQNGHEVLYLGRRQDVRSLVRAAVDEDVDVLGISVLSGTHHDIIHELLETVQREQADLAVVIGGTILRSEIPSLEQRGVDAVFPVGTSLKDISEWFSALPARRSGAERRPA